MRNTHPMLATFGQRMRERREELGLSQAALAELLNCSRAAVSNFEAGRSWVGIDTLVMLCDELATTPDGLLGYDTTPRVDHAQLQRARYEGRKAGQREARKELARAIRTVLR